MISETVFHLPSLTDPVSLESITDPIRFEPCHHIVDATTAKLFLLGTGECPLCRKKIEKKVPDKTTSMIINLLQQINLCQKGSEKQIQLSYALGSCIISPSNNQFNNPINLEPCGHALEESVDANRVLICPVLFCKTEIKSRYKDFNLKMIIDEVIKVIHEIQFDSRVTRKEVVAGHFDNDESIMKLAEGISTCEGIVEELTIQDHSCVTNAGFISFISRFIDTIKTVKISFSPRGLSKEIFSYLQNVELNQLCLIGSQTLVDEHVVGLISNMKLKSLNLLGCGVRSECLPHLKKMTTLQNLALDKASFTQSEQEELQKALQQTLFNFC